MVAGIPLVQTICSRISFCLGVTWLITLRGGEAKSTMSVRNYNLRKNQAQKMGKIELIRNTLKTGSFKLFKRPFPGFLTILTL